MATITVIQPSIMTEAVKRRVAAYCRVSSSSEDQLNSYQAQLTYYSHKFEDSDTEELVDLYGSNINLEQMAYRCPNSKVVGTKMIPDYELEFRGVATIVPKEGAEVPVLLWEIDQRDELSLDRYEGFPRMYRKELFEVEVDGKIREGMAYLMNCGEIAPPSPVYYNAIKKGYEANGMDTSYLRAALERAVYHAQHQEQEEDEDIEEDMEETDDFQMTFE